MSQQLKLKINGLFTDPNNFSEVPQGGLAVANNLVINKDSLAESRRGQRIYGDPLVDTSSFHQYVNNLLIHADSKLYWDSDNAGTFTQQGTTYEPAGDKIRSAEANRNFYFTTNEGVFKLDSLPSTPTLAGGLKGLDGTGSLTSSGASIGTGFLEYDNQVAYRAIFGITDANGNLIFGAPTGRIIVTNPVAATHTITGNTVASPTVVTSVAHGLTTGQTITVSGSNSTPPINGVQVVTVTGANTFTVPVVVTVAGTAGTFTIDSETDAENVFLTFTLPEGITTEHIIQVYRSGLSGGASIEPSDELGLVHEAAIAATNITSGVYQFMDETPNDLRGATLYTSPSQEGIVNSNLPPPIAKDIALFADQTFYANTKQPERTELTLLSSEWGSFQMSCSFTSGQTRFSTFDPNISRLAAGTIVFGSGIPPNTVVLAVSASVAGNVEISNPVSLTLSTTLTFFDFIVIDGVKYAGTTSSNNPSNNRFHVETVGTPAQIIEQNCRNLIEVINRSTTNTTVYASYLSGVEDLPGRMLFEGRTAANSQFNIEGSGGEEFFSPHFPHRWGIEFFSATNPGIINAKLPTGYDLVTGDVITITGSTCTPNVDGEWVVTIPFAGVIEIPVNITVPSPGNASGYFIVNKQILESEGETRVNRVYISKIGQPEAVPIYSYVDIGSANYEIHRIIPLRDALFVFKDDGVFRIVGDSIHNFQVSTFDSTIRIIAYNTLTTLSNQIYGLTDQGAASFSDNGGVGVISRPIEGALLELLDHAAITTSFAIGYESERLYILALPTFEEADETPSQILVYNYFTTAWTRWTLARVAGGVNRRDGKLYMATDTDILIERKNLDDTDFADLEFAVSIVSSSGLTVTLVDASDLEVGMTLVQADSEAVILEINGNILTLSQIEIWVAGPAIAYTPIRCEFEWLPLDATNSGLIKQWRECTFFFKETNLREFSVLFSTNVSTAVQTTLITIPTLGFGYGGFGDGLFGGGDFGQKAVRTLVPQSKQRSHLLNLALFTEESFVRFALQGVSLVFNQVSERSR